MNAFSLTFSVVFTVSPYPLRTRLSLTPRRAPGALVCQGRAHAASPQKAGGQVTPGALPATAARQGRCARAVGLQQAANIAVPLPHPPGACVSVWW